MAELFRLPRGGMVLLSPCNALDYLRAYQPLCVEIDAAFRRCGQSFGDLISDPEGWDLLGMLLGLFALDLSEFDGAWVDLQELTFERLPKLHTMPELEFARLSKDKGQGSGDRLADLVANLPEGLAFDSLSSLDMASVYRIQWLNNQAAERRLTPKERDEIATAIAMDQVNAEAAKAQAQWSEFL